MDGQQLSQASAKSNEALKKLGGEVQWQQSYVTQDKLFCVYNAPNEELVRRHAELSGFPASKITQVKTVIDPATGDAGAVRKVA